jgi:hypothetical protein
MLDLTGLIAMSFLGVGGFWIGFYAARTANEIGLKICTGVVDGTTVPTAQRWQMLYNMWVPYQSGGFMATIFFGVAQLLMASLVDSEGVKLLAYLAVVIAAVACLFWMATGIVIFMNYRSVLRQAEAD